MESLIAPKSSFPLEDRPIPDLPGEVLLEQHRRRAEAKLIKASIMKKVYDGIELSNIEKSYVNKWFNEIRGSEEDNVGNTCIPKKESKLTLVELTGMDRYKLNSIPLVNITNEYKDFALSDLIFEISHFIDTSFVESVHPYIILDGKRVILGVEGKARMEDKWARS
jgi:hypothetical protein